MGDNIIEPQRSSSAAAGVELQAKKIKGGVIGVFGTNANAAVRYLQVHDSAATPAEGAVPVLSIPMPALGAYTSLSPPFAIPFQAGIYVCASSTQNTKTVAVANEHIFTVLYS